MSSSIFPQFCRLEVFTCIGCESGNAPPILYHNLHPVIEFFLLVQPHFALPYHEDLLHLSRIRMGTTMVSLCCRKNMHPVASRVILSKKRLFALVRLSQTIVTLKSYLQEYRLMHDYSFD